MNIENNVQLMELSALQPSQLYINREKLALVQSQVDFSRSEHIPPIPVKALQGRQVMTDGHTRAFGAFLDGLSSVRTYEDPDELDWEAYLICVEWCQAEGVYSVADLQGRVVGSQDYERLWIDRCRVMHAELANRRGD